MNAEPTLLPTFDAAPDTRTMATFVDLPALGRLAINAYVLRAKDPVLVDTGIPALREPFLRALAKEVPLDELKWIYLTHGDPDHTGALWDVLEQAPNARLVTTFLGFGKLSLVRAVPPERVFLLNPGQSLDLGDRQLVAMRPPTYDAPESTALFDTKTRAFFSADTFGALLPTSYDDARAVPADALRDGLTLWTTVDAPWLSSLTRDAFERVLATVRDLSPAYVLSSHLPPARGMNDVLLSHLEGAREAPLFVGPDQEAMMRMMAPQA